MERLCGRQLVLDKVNEPAGALTYNWAPGEGCVEKKWKETQELETPEPDQYSETNAIYQVPLVERLLGMSK
jgi:hypothetical protein